MSLWLINDLIGGPRLITGLVEESWVPVVNVSESVSSHCFSKNFSL
jgi:hypothetical protein